MRSILGRFLEHSRIIHFRAIDEFWIGSADMMHRNLDRRVEVMAQVKDPRLTAQLNDVFESAMDPATRCWELVKRVTGPRRHRRVTPYATIRCRSWNATDIRDERRNAHRRARMTCRS